jgi:hypothetical protein
MHYLLLLLALLAPQQDQSTRTAHWNEDLTFFKDNFKTKHIKPFTKITEAEFDQALQAINPDMLNAAKKE